MSVTAHDKNTQTAVVGTEHTLCDVAVTGTFTLHVDCINMVAGDAVELRILQMVLTAGTRRVVYFDVFYGAQTADDMIKISVPISNELADAGALRFTLKQTTGTARAFPWKCLRYS